MFLVSLGALLALVVYTAYTRQLVTDTEQSYRDVQRAFVTVVPMKSEARIVDGEKVFVFTTTIENSGNTPTRNLSFSQRYPCLIAGPSTVGGSPGVGPVNSCEVRGSGGQFDGAIGPSDPSSDPPGHIITLQTQAGSMLATHAYPLGPHQQIAIASVAMPGTEIARRQKIGAFWYVEGAISYDDVFGGPHHVTKYCFYVYQWGVGGGGDEPHYAPCPRWNCTDDECNAA